MMTNHRTQEGKKKKKRKSQHFFVIIFLYIQSYNWAVLCSVELMMDVEHPKHVFHKTKTCCRLFELRGLLHLL